MTERVEQRNHFFEVGDRVVWVECKFKRMSLRDVYINSVTYAVVEVTSRDSFKIREIE